VRAESSALKGVQMRTYFFKNIGTMDSERGLQNVVAITERPMNGLDPCFSMAAESVANAMFQFLENCADDESIYHFVISKDLH